MQYSQDHLKTMVYAEFGGQTECIMGNWKIENRNWADIKSGVKIWQTEQYTPLTIPRNTHRGLLD